MLFFYYIIKSLVLSITRILRATLAKFRVYVCMYVCDKTPPKPLNRFA